MSNEAVSGTVMDIGITAGISGIGPSPDQILDKMQRARISGVRVSANPHTKVDGKSTPVKVNGKPAFARIEFTEQPQQDTTVRTILEKIPCVRAGSLVIAVSTPG